MHCLHLIQAIEEQGYFCTNWFSTESWTQARQWDKPGSWNVSPGGLPLAPPSCAEGSWAGGFSIRVLGALSNWPPNKINWSLQHTGPPAPVLGDAAMRNVVCKVLSPSPSSGILRDLVLTTPWGSGPAPTGSGAASQPGVPSFKDEIISKHSSGLCHRLAVHV